MQRFPSIVHTCRGIQACTYCITGRIVASGRCVLYMMVSKVIISYDNVNNSFKCVINIALCDAAQCNIAIFDTQGRMYLPRIASFPTMMKMMMILLFDSVAINDGFADNDDHDDADNEGKRKVP